jgi:hypothetical protein
MEIKTTRVSNEEGEQHVKAEETEANYLLALVAIVAVASIFFFA